VLDAVPTTTAGLRGTLTGRVLESRRTTVDDVLE